MAAAEATLSERKPARIGTVDPRIGGGMDLIRHSGAFPAEQQDVAGAERKVEVGDLGARRQQDKAIAGLPPRRLETMPVDVPHNLRMAEIVHPGAPERTVRHVEARRSDHVDRDAEASAEAENVAGVLRYVGLVERERDHDSIPFRACILSTAP